MTKDLLDDFWAELDFEIQRIKSPAEKIQVTAEKFCEVLPEFNLHLQEEKVLTSEAFFDTLFNPGEFVCFDNNKCFNVHKVPYQIGYKNVNSYFCINPLKGNRNDENVKAFRNMLFEWDKDEFENIIPLDKQEEIVNTIGLPYTTKIYSGGKSYHHIISVIDGFKDKEEYVAHFKAIHDLIVANGFTAPDKACSNPGRFSRCPNANNIKTSKKQELLAILKPITKADLVKWIESKGGKVVRWEPKIQEVAFETSLSSQEKFKIIKHWPEKQWGIYGEGKRHNYRVSLFRLCKRAGIEKWESINLIDSEFPLKGDTAHTAWNKEGMEPLILYKDSKEKKIHENSVETSLVNKFSYFIKNKKNTI